MRSPRELSSIAARGAFNNAESFAVLEGLGLDFGRYSFEIGSGAICLDTGSCPSRGLFTVPIENHGAGDRRIGIERRFVKDGVGYVESRVITMRPGETADAIDPEPLDLESLFPGRTDLHVVAERPRHHWDHSP